MSTVIKVENLSKKYLLHHERLEKYTALRDVIMDAAKGFPRRFRKGISSRQNLTNEEFWALKNVSFDIQQGDRIGIIGRNGAGKSTLLKILSRITEPTSGKVSIKGRIASLLEVGTGFHPELTGRENIFLNGAILGMSRGEIKRKFDEIVAFAEVERFLDTPVKRYSSGMYVRLAFAVAAHLEPEILVIDEVLAVGDALFQKKCLGKMEEVGREGRTVIFVSHDMTAVAALCNQAILLSSGSILGRGDVQTQITNYLNVYHNNQNTKSVCRLHIGTNLLIEQFEFSSNTITSGEDIEYVITLKANSQCIISGIAVVFYTLLGMRVAIIDLRKSDGQYIINPDNLFQIKGIIKSLPFIEGDYQVSLYLDSGEVNQEFTDLLSIHVINKSDNKGFAPYPARVCGVVALDSDFAISLL